MPFTMRAAPRFNYGSDPHVVSAAPDGVLFTSSDLSLYLTSTRRLVVEDGDAVAEFTLEEGEAAVRVEEVHTSTRLRACDEKETLDELMAATVRFWWRWLAASRYRGRWREVVHRSALALKLLTYAPTGAIVAAPTTSLPELIGGERNWDYRYVWVRDAAFCVYALLRLGFTRRPTPSCSFLRRAPPRERSAAAPAGHVRHRRPPGSDGVGAGPGRIPGVAPVRVGNGAARQLQLDIYGELMDSVYLYDKWANPLSSDQWEAVRERTGFVSTGISLTRGSGRHGAVAGNSCIPSSCAGWRSNGRFGCPFIEGCPRIRSAGGRSATRSTAASCSRAGHLSETRSSSMRATRCSMRRCS